jgi:nicotinate-nucleotide adenylyltransferase
LVTVKSVSRKPKTRVVFGGTFDPFHNGHEAIANAVLRSGQVDELRLIPCAVPALKSQASASSEDRMAMLQAWSNAIDDEDKVVVDDIELNRPGKSYTVETFETLTAMHPEDQWIFVLGTDAWNSLPKWHRVERLFELVSFWVFSRNGERPAQLHANLTLCDEQADLFMQGKCGLVYWDDQVKVPVSSTRVRAGYGQHDADTPKVISDYINKRGLYRETTDADNTVVKQ